MPDFGKVRREKAVEYFTKQIWQKMSFNALFILRFGIVSRFNLIWLKNWEFN
ncbi:MAG: hypothetical protein K0R73_128 [Candidatus Midichloriaceae bacterium]|jgi:hypothetical protein|nr:hypothetical protein [Candidatus Midichloriaceae bacterium]